MRIAAMAAGAVGGYFGARMAAAGHDVFFIGRGAHLDALKESGRDSESVHGDRNLRQQHVPDDAAQDGPGERGRWGAQTRAAPRTGSVGPEAVRTCQRERSAALLAADIPASRGIHADDFQLVTPLGDVFSREEYLGAVEAGIIKSLVLELESPVAFRL